MQTACNWGAKGTQAGRIRSLIMRRPSFDRPQESVASRMNASDRPLFEPIPGLEDMALHTQALNAFVPAQRGMLPFVLPS